LRVNSSGNRVEEIMMKPLAGLRILDFSTLLPGPYATMMLADLGAEVVRVESPDRDDLVRSMAPRIGGQSAAFRYLNRGKRSVTLDLKHGDAQALVKQMVRDYDIVIEQFRPGVMKRLGLDYAALSAVNPALIYCSVTGFGQTGDYASRAGHDINFLALSGVASHMGRASDGPAPLGVQVADVAAGSHPAVIGILAAVIQRNATGQGCEIDISMADNSFALQALLGTGALNGEADPAPESHFLNGGGFYDYYATRDGRYMAVGSLEPQFKQRLLSALGLDALAQASDRVLKPAIREVFATQGFEHWCAVFAQIDCCVEPVLTVSEAAGHPAFSSRGLVMTNEDGERQVASAIRFNGILPALPETAPLRGANTDEVLQGAGLTQEEINQYRADGLFG
jgi:alpha-methylacyl-CoA racemase